MPLYTDDYAKSIIRLLEEVGGNLLTNLRYEIQDGGDVLLMSATLATDLQQLALDDLCNLIKRKVGGKLPNRSGDYAWMINLLKNDNIAASITADIITR